MDNVNGFDNSTKWNYSLWTPDAVIALIGPNDKPGSEFVEEYLSFLETVAGNYKGKHVTIISVCGGSINGLQECPDIVVANKQFNAQSEHPTIQGYYVSIKLVDWQKINNPAWDTKYKGCSSHYNELGHAILANDILPQIKPILGW